MEEALSLHNLIIRRECYKGGGYEVKTIGDSFMVAFADPVGAVQFGMDVQESLSGAEWAEAPEFGAVSDKWQLRRDTLGNVVWHGIAVRIGISVGEVRDEVNPVSMRVDYRGRAVNQRSRHGSIRHSIVVIQ
eukprot:gene56695-biopygen83433